MLEVLKVFYPTHYNLAALSILLLLITIFLLTKKNLKIAPIFLALFLVLNVAIYKKTSGMAWTITVESDTPEDTYDDGFKREPEKVTFSVTNWEYTDKKGEKHHWCWVEDAWEVIANTDVIAAIWGENAGKKVKTSTESRIEDANNLGK
ncbi:MAG: hypothetical protein HUK20_02510 [Fibrobacter sp.]|nr:hypothetical protein [Fibrobacter sp.]